MRKCTVLINTCSCDVRSLLLFWVWPILWLKFCIYPWLQIGAVNVTQQDHPHCLSAEVTLWWKRAAPSIGLCNWEFCEDISVVLSLNLFNTPLKLWTATQWIEWVGALRNLIPSVPRTWRVVTGELFSRGWNILRSKTSRVSMTLQILG